jgi:GNAT superfamily N-acetyltransferase
MKKKYLDTYEFDDDKGRLNLNLLEAWLSNTYWSPRIKRWEIQKGAENSTLVVGCYSGPEQVGYMRLVSDKTRFGYIMDVYVDELHRKKGIAQNMIHFAMDHPELKDVYQWVLATQDAHLVYEKLGFKPLSNPERWMILYKEKIRE